MSLWSHGANSLSQYQGHSPTPGPTTRHGVRVTLWPKRVLSSSSSQQPTYQVSGLNSQVSSVVQLAVTHWVWITARPAWSCQACMVGSCVELMVGGVWYGVCRLDTDVDALTLITIPLNREIASVIVTSMQKMSSLIGANILELGPMRPWKGMKETWPLWPASGPGGSVVCSSSSPSQTKHAALLLDVCTP
ncbi:hypothetical protein HaLaN_19351 [Haematococcus lacustris]|uniref:Uncharacterized protein n=1 Tax=Haematococcus lacustris TaxID=44745 RepID=A0A699ZLK5_HAELA|nr:hypothetical protein HaLaN_19351 [Haematococcus lacustris]